MVKKTTKEAEENELVTSYKFHATKPITKFDPNSLVSQNPSLGLYVNQRYLQLKDLILIELNKEQRVGNIANFTPVFLALGIYAYYSAASEPNFAVLFGTLFIAILITTKVKANLALYYALSAVMLVMLGMNAAKFQVELVYKPYPNDQITAQLKGLVIKSDMNARGAPRYMIKPLAIDGFDPKFLPDRIRVSSTRKHETFLPGSQISGLARLQPVSSAAYPGGYDFAFHAWFNKRGMSGFFMGSPKTDSSKIAISLFETVEVKINLLRLAIAKRVRKHLVDESGAIAIALITGDRSQMSQETQEQLRRSGLAHILAISGLHMALVTLTVIWLARALLAIPKSLSARYPVKKIALVIGFCIATLYLAISGYSIATQRAWLMISVMLFAGILDRRAITMRSVAISATIILLISPASLFQPGFQMSFAAVAALVAFYQSWNKRKRENREFSNANAGPIRTCINYMSGLGATSLIAGLATAMISTFHFHRFATLGLFANLAAMPIVSLFVMPLALLSVILMPYGFEHIGLMPLGAAIDLVVDIARTIDQSASNVYTGAKPISFIFWGVCALCAFCLTTSKIRYLALIPFGVFLIVSVRNIEVPHLMISQDGRTIAVSTLAINQLANDPQNNGVMGEGAKVQNALMFSYPRRNKFIQEIWAKAFSQNRIVKDDNAFFKCDKDACSFEVKDKQVAIIYAPEKLKQACQNSDILIAPRLWWVRCKEKKPDLILKRSDFQQKGSHMFWFTSRQTDAELADEEVSEIRIETAWPTNQYWSDKENKIPADYPLTQFANDLLDSRRPWHHRYDLPKPNSNSKKKVQPSSN